MACQPAAFQLSQSLQKSYTHIPMPTQQLLDRVRELRDAGRTPKEIARALKMPPRRVSPKARLVVIRDQ